jgi:MSHA biogenesis protein MshJ
MNRLLALFNRLGPRERLGVIIGLLAAVYLVLDLSLVGPEEKRLKRLKADVATLDAQLGVIRADMVVIKTQLDKDPHAKDRAQLDAYRKVIDEANAFLAQVESDPRQVGQLLREVIAATPGLALVSMRTLPPVAIVDRRSAGKEGLQRSVFRRGIEVTVKGNYVAMLPYLEKLQGLPTRVLWVDADLSVVAYPDATLKLLIYTLGDEAGGALG